MTDQLICVRIAQAVLPVTNAAEYSKFPFDRVYLGKKELAHKIKRMFRYYMTLNLDQHLMTALGRLDVKRVKETKIIRNDAELEGVAVTNKRNYFLDHIVDINDWMLVVPTHVRTIYRRPDLYEEPSQSELAYILSKAIDHNHNRQVQLPRITLVTPRRTVPILCGVCRQVLEMHAGNCLPGQPTCAFRAKVRLAYDDHNSLTSQKSVDASGDF